MSAPKYMQFLDAQVKLPLAELEKKLAAGPTPRDLGEWDLTVDEWELAMKDAIREVRDRHS